MGSPFFAYISRLRYISRWGLMRNTFTENVQEHSHMVAVLAHALAVIHKDIFGGTIDPGAVTIFALYHDASEIFTGDLPTPVKYQNPDIQLAYKKVEESALRQLLATLPSDLQPSYTNALSQVDEKTLLFVKAADKLSAYVKCLEELKAGNLEFKSASEQIKHSLDTMNVPELDYFMEQFLPAFSLTLDEL